MTHRFPFPVLFAFLVFAITIGSGCTPQEVHFESQFPETITRTWAGPLYYANRLMDWQIQDGRLESLEGSPNRPMRTVHLLTYALGSAPGTLTMQVQTGPLDTSGIPHDNTWTGFLIGAGGDHVDYRISALTHHWPGEDGGLIVGVDGTGQIIVRDNAAVDTPSGPGQSYPATTWARLDASASQDLSELPEAMVIDVLAQPTGDTYQLIVTVRDDAGGVLGSAEYDGIAASYLTGNVALVSHNSLRMEGPGYWFRDWQISGSKVLHHPERAFGPVMGTQYTLSRGTLKLTAQGPPLGADDNQEARLEVERGGQWQTVATASLTPYSATFPFRVDDWDDSEDVPYRVVYDLLSGEGKTTPYTYSGTIRRAPVDKEEFVVASLNCNNISAGRNLQWNHSTIWHPHQELVEAVRYHEPDFLFFAGDQLYEGGLAGIIRQPAEKATLDYLYHWYRWVWAFGELTRDRPTVTIPDDHDVYHGNVFGHGGKAATGPHRPASDNGGYIMDPLFVNAVHRTQVSHLPDPVDPAPIEQGITVYHTDIQYAGMSFAVLADRMWKTSPTLVLPEANVVNGWVQNPDFDPVSQADVPEAVLLGQRQLGFLDTWAEDWSNDTWMKVVLSQTVFQNVATLPAEASGDQVVPRLPYAAPGEYIEGDKMGADMDSNGWPQTGRNEAVRAMRKGFAFHLAGDQHLGSFTQYGVDTWRDGPHAFVSPAIANIWPRRWFPPVDGQNREADAPRYTGDFLDGFGNKMTVLAVANPVKSGREPSLLYDRMPGYGIARFNRTERTMTAEAWPRWVDPAHPESAQFTGWPQTIQQEENFIGQATYHLPEIVVTGMAHAVLQVIDEQTDTLLYTLRLQGTRYQPKVFDATRTYTVRVGEPGTDQMQTLSGLSVTSDPSVVEQVTF